MDWLLHRLYGELQYHPSTNMLFVRLRLHAHPLFSIFLKDFTLETSQSILYSRIDQTSAAIKWSDWLNFALNLHGNFSSIGNNKPNQVANDSDILFADSCSSGQLNDLEHQFFCLQQ